MVWRNFSVEICAYFFRHKAQKQVAAFSFPSSVMIKTRNVDIYSYTCLNQRAIKFRKKNIGDFSHSHHAAMSE